jgi:excisionase family DNA binding protein
MENEMLTIEEVARFLRCSKSKIYQMVADQKIPHYRYHKRPRFKMSDLLEWLDRNKVC